ncbi:MAG: lysostaphin resistance A-like protein [Nevskiaceae bacterium]
MVLALLPFAAGAADEPPAPEVPVQAPAPAVEPFPISRNTRKAVLWSLLPGGGHFYLGDTTTGVTYAGLTAAFLLGGAEVQRRNERLDRDDDEVNVPYLLADKVWEYSIFTTTREALLADGVDLRRYRLDDTPTSELLAAPFSREALRPQVWGAALLGVGLGALAAHDREDGPLSDVQRVRMFGGSYEQDDANRMYVASAFGISLGAATAEEGLFRGLLQPYLQGLWGERAGFWAAAGTFGAAHVVGLDGGFNPAGVAAATAGGAYFGWLYERDGNRLAAPIAAHFWYDFALITTLWVVDPENNPLGFDVQFSF